MPILIEESDSVTTLKLHDRCSIDDLGPVVGELIGSLERSPSLKIDSSTMESVDSAVVQLLLSAIKSSNHFIEDEDHPLDSIQKRWGLDLQDILNKEKQSQN